jgi:NAD(P)H dehydrogenase (quinone)
MLQPRILVTGSTGKTGMPTALGLVAKGFPVRALVHRNDARAGQLQAAGVEVMVGSLESMCDLGLAMKGVRRAYFCPPLEPGTLRRAALFAAAAQEARLEAVVQLSQWVADANHPAVHAREKWLTSQVLSWTPDVGVITVQPGWFADNYFAVVGQAAQFGLFGLPLGQGLNAPPSNEDIARVIVACLVDPAPHIGKAYRPTGPRLLAPGEIAELLGVALGRKVKYQDVPLPMFLKAAVSLGLSEFVIAQLYWFLQDYQAGAFGIGAPTSVVEEVAGVAPEDFLTIAKRYVRTSPSAERGMAGALREAGGLVAALLARKPDIGRIEARFGAPRLETFVLAGSRGPGWQRTPKAGRRITLYSAIAQQFLDAALQLALLDFALAQPLIEIGDGFGRAFRPEGNADKIVAPPDHFGQERAALARDAQRYLLFRQRDDIAEFDGRAPVGDVADDAVARGAAFADLGDAAIHHLVARALASVRH